MLDQSQRNVIAEDIDPAASTGDRGQFIDAPASGEIILRFRSYVLYPASRTLLRDGAPVSIGGRAFDLLVILLRNRGVVTSKSAITEYVWPATFLEEGNLRFQVAALRKVLGPDAGLIKTVTGRGYLLAAEAGSDVAFKDDEGRAEAQAAIVLDAAPVRAAETGFTPAALLEELLQTVGKLVASYGSLEDFLRALGSHPMPEADRLPAALYPMTSHGPQVRMTTIA